MFVSNCAAETELDLNFLLPSEHHLASACVAIGAGRVKQWSKPELSLCSKPATFETSAVESWISRLRRGQDPLGDVFCRLRSPGQRRERGATYTPARIVRAMVQWARSSRERRPVRVVDPGVGSGRFLIAAGRAFPDAELIGVDIDPLATLVARANLAAVGFADRSTVLITDYRDLKLSATTGRTLFIGNPPYVRHHLIEPQWKKWLTERASKHGLRASQLAGLHVHFFLATVMHGRPGDFGAFITAAEWLDVNYGRLMRDLFLNGLGGEGLTVIDPTAQPFADAAATAVITTFEIGARPRTVQVRRVEDMGSLELLGGGQRIDRSRLEGQVRWSYLTSRPKQVPSGFVELGEICRVHRGQVTGANHIWIAAAPGPALPPSVLFRTVTRARELFAAEGVLRDDSALRQVIDIPVELDVLTGEDRKTVDRFLKWAREAGGADGYIAAKRKAWWSVGLRTPAPILATYMARRPPVFVRNLVSARHLNIAHGLYPREPLAPAVLSKLAEYLSQSVRIEDGRTYAGGLTKFEPREMERLLVPNPDLLRKGIRAI